MLKGWTTGRLLSWLKWSEGRTKNYVAQRYEPILRRFGTAPVYSVTLAEDVSDTYEVDIDPAADAVMCILTSTSLFSGSLIKCTAELEDGETSQYVAWPTTSTTYGIQWHFYFERGKLVGEMYKLGTTTFAPLNIAPDLVITDADSGKIAKCVLERSTFPAGSVITVYVA